MFQQQLSQFQSKMQSTEVTGTAGNGLVTITLSGENDMKQIKIKPECVDAEDIEGLETLIKAAYQDAHHKLKSQSMPELPNLDAFGL
jgi:DNA-binding YbaB/EbfC family protein